MNLLKVGDLEERLEALEGVVLNRSSDDHPAFDSPVA
jgi:hypothetical protein